MNQNYFNYCLEKFNDLPDPVREFLDSPSTAQIVKRIEDKYSVSLSFLVILVAISELDFINIPEYLEKKYKIEKNRAELIAAEIIEEVFEPLFIQEGLTNQADIDDALGDEDLFIEPLINHPLEERQQAILDIFQEKLVPTLKADNSTLKELNLAIFKTFNDNPILEGQVESLLYNSQEKLTSKSIILDGHPASPSVANWLKDFIKTYGSSLFSEISLAEYLVGSPNLKNLVASEKELVRKLLKLYRNLVFFPESLAGILLENWEVFPLEVIASDSLAETTKLLKHSSPIPEEKNSGSTPVSKEAPPIVAEVQAQKDERGQLIYNLEKSLIKYSTSSLEYKALQQEINRLRQKK